MRPDRSRDVLGANVLEIQVTDYVVNLDIEIVTSDVTTLLSSLIQTLITNMVNLPNSCV